LCVGIENFGMSIKLTKSDSLGLIYVQVKSRGTAFAIDAVSGRRCDLVPFNAMDDEDSALLG